jgi:hypothetical protein
MKRAIPPEAVAAPEKLVAVNLDAGVYHCEGTTGFEGHKREGVITQKQAVEKGFRPAFGKVCE